MYHDMDFSLDPAALSSNQTNLPFVSWTIPAGRGFFSSRISLITCDFDSPVATKIHSLELLMTGKVMVTLSGGGFGESPIKASHFEVSYTF